MFNKLFSLGVLVCIAFTIHAQKQVPRDWFSLDMEEDDFPGISIDKAYEELLEGRKARKVIVAVLDSGVDPQHEDLEQIIWVNRDEVPDNGLDDDQNGYVDDVNGWNFIGGSDGRNVHYDTKEVTRLYVKLRPRFESANPLELSTKEKREYARYLEYKREIEEKREELKLQSEAMHVYNDLVNVVKMSLPNDENITALDIREIDPKDNPTLVRAKGVLPSIIGSNNLQSFEKQLERAIEYLDSRIEYGYNPNFDPRHIVGDNYDNPKEKYYGNNDVEGPYASHGTHVAGVIAAQRGNNLGIDGVANNVELMILRIVPDGDERDKDVANAIRYAVDNGASIINMSFAKGYSWNKKIVDKAVRYAMKKDVLIVHAAGNDAYNIDVVNSYPVDQLDYTCLFGPKVAENWIEVGATDWRSGKDLAADFSDYGNTNVDIFAPGVDIYSTIPENKYESFPGTSVAAPMVTGVAALLRGYYPDLNAEEVKDILLTSAINIETAVHRPGTENDLVTFDELCKTGGILNAYNALKFAFDKYGLPPKTDTPGTASLTH